MSTGLVITTTPIGDLDTEAFGAVLHRDLVAYVPMTEAANSARADVIGGRSFTDVNGVGTEPGTLADTAAFSAGNLEQLVLPSTPGWQIAPGKDWSLAVWAYFDDQDITQAIVTKRDGTANEWELYLFNTARLFFTITGTISGGTSVSTAVSSILPNAWHFIVVWWDAQGRTVNIQLDLGVPTSVPATFVGEPMVSNSNVYIGSYGAATFFNGGRIGPIGVWQRQLANSEKQYLWNDGQGVSFDMVRPSLAYSHRFTTSEFFESGYFTNFTDYYDSSTFTYVQLTTLATVLAVDVYSNMASPASFPQFSQVYVRVNGANYAALNVRSNGSHRLYVNLPAGNTTVVITSSLQTKPNVRSGTFLVGVAGNAALTVAPATTSARLVVYGDSITAGANCDVPSREAWAILLRNLRGNVMLEAWGFRSLWDDCFDAGHRTSFAARLAAYNPIILWLAIGTNDYGLARWSAANFGVAYADLLDKIHAALPGCFVYCQTPLTRTSEVANSFGDTLGAYRTQIATARAARPTYTALVDGSAWSIALDTDGLHPTAAGHASYYTNVKGVLGL
jgi:lysophospholipase L1-like esterase